jgi:hypothetical protein
MSHIRSVFTICLLIVIAAIVPTTQAQVATPKAIISGSSAIWQSAALGAYNSGNCVAGLIKPCFHYTSKVFQVNDRRETLNARGGAIKSDVNTIWIVWDSHTTTAGAAPNFFAYIKVDSVVGDRCYYAQPRCDVTTSPIGTAWPAPANAITVWPDSSVDGTPPTNLQNLFTALTGPKASAAATDIRAEDGMWAICRANSNYTGGTPDQGMAGLGYNPNNSAGVCPPNVGAATPTNELDGGDISDASGATAHILAFNVTPGGKDPFTGTTIVTGTTVPTGAAPIVFVAHVGIGSDPLATVTSVTDTQLQSLFHNTGAGCDGTTLGGSAGNIDVWLREPLSGTYNTTDSNIFSYPDLSGASMEAFLNVTSAGGNPLNQACPAGGGNRKRGVGTSHVIDTGTVTDTTNDSIAFTFFGYGNVKAASDTKCTPGVCRYLKLNGIDPIFHKYWSSGDPAPADPGQPHTTTGQIPSAADNAGITGCSGGLPCREDQIWKGGLSFPNLRSGQYSAWSVLRLISDGTTLANVKNLVASSQLYAAINTPDFVPIVTVAANSTTGFPGDPGLQLLRSHSVQHDNAGTVLGAGTAVDDATTGDVGSDMGGCIEHFLPGVTANQIKESDAILGLIHTTPGTECSFAPTSH